MVTKELQKKIDQSIKLLQSAGRDGEVIELAYSGGKDSDVILQLAKEAGINFRAIYKNTTIDPPGTIKHVREMGVEIRQPKMSFFKLIEKNGFPNRFTRFCCRFLKEYKILDRNIMGVRKAESTKRAARYVEPTECRYYGSKKEHVEAFYPILEWTDDDVLAFILDRKLKLAPVYYKKDGTIDIKRRLGCMCCPMASNRKRIEQFKEHPGMVKAYIKNGIKYRKDHPNVKTCRLYASVYEWFVRDVFYDRQYKFDADRQNLFGEMDYKQFLENYFKIKLP